MYILRTESSANKSGGYAYTRYVFEQHGGKVKGRLVVSKVMHGSEKTRCTEWKE